MNTLPAALPRLSFALLAAFLLTMAVRSHNDTTVALVMAALFMFAACWANAVHLMGAKAAGKFVLIAVGLGWFAEQMGSSRGWFFGSYSYTEVLGWQLGNVPMIIPLMWFALCYVGFVISNFCIWRRPVEAPGSLAGAAFLSFMAAAIVTAYDLGADPYFVFVLKAWVMAKTDGWWFGETLQGFVGWMLVGFVILFLFRLSVRKQGLAVNPEFSKWQAAVPFAIYAVSMLFQVLQGDPVETRTIAVFAMGLPLLCGLAGWWQWRDAGGAAGSLSVPSPVSDARLSQMQYAADPLADETIATILGPWATATPAEQLIKIGLVNRQLDQWTSNQSIAQWQSSDPQLPPGINHALQRYLQSGQALPDWADPTKIARAEVLFMEYGALSCSLLFCSSLPECYVIPDLSLVLQAAGQLEQHTEHRIRATAAMIFPVMMHGGLTQADGSGVAQTLKVRLIHATIRHLILHGSPADAMRALGEQLHVKGAGMMAAQTIPKGANLQQALLAHGWKLGEDGLPCNQEELGYTLLTFAYVFLRSMRQLGLRLASADEEAFLHAWNVMGHLLGIRRELMADTMAQAQALFAQMQARGAQDPVSPDPRPTLGKALMDTMEKVIPFTLLKPFPVLLTRYLCGVQNAQAIGVDGRVSWLSKTLFVLVLVASGLIDSVVRLLLPEFSIARFFTRVVGYHFMSKILLDQTRPLKLPDHLLNQVGQMMAAWSDDPKAPAWVNQIEDKLTKPGQWTAAMAGKVNE